MARIDDVLAAIAAEKTVEDSAITLIAGLSEQLAALKDSGGATPAQLDNVISLLQGNSSALAAAVTANTPAAPAAPPAAPAAAPATDTPAPTA